MTAGAGGRVAPLTHANPTLKHQRRSAAEVRGALPPRVSSSLAELMGANTPSLITGIFQKGKKKKHQCHFGILKGADHVWRWSRGREAGIGGANRDPTVSAANYLP